MTVWYNIVSNELYLQWRHFMEVGSYEMEYEHAIIIVPNHLGLMRWRINMANWKKAVSSGLIIKIGRL